MVFAHSSKAMVLLRAKSQLVLHFFDISNFSGVNQAQLQMNAVGYDTYATIMCQLSQ
jgi:hypothetical protein